MLLPLVFLSLSCASLTGCSGGSGERTEGAPGGGAPGGPPGGGPPPALVRVAKVQSRTIAPRLLAVGTVRPRHTSVIASAAEGVVEDFPAEKGQFVKQGTVLSRLRMESTDLALDQQRAVLSERKADYEQTLKPRPEDVEEARGQRLAAQASLANAERRLKELRSLAGRGASTVSEVKESELLVDEAQQRLVAAKAVFDRVSAGTREEEREQARSRMLAQEKYVAWLEAEKDKRITRAPFDGFIISEQTFRGQWLSRGDPVVTMAMLDQVDVEVPVDQDFVSQISVGDTVQMRVAGTPFPSSDDGRWAGRIRSVVPRSEWETGSRSFPVIVRIENLMTGLPEAPVPTLREGMMAEVEFFGAAFRATLVPKDSLVRTSRGVFVFAVNPAKGQAPLSVRQVMVQPGISDGEWIEVTGEDLGEGVQVVTEGAERLRPFQSVQILPAEKASDAGEAGR